MSKIVGPLVVGFLIPTEVNLHFWSTVRDFMLAFVMSHHVMRWQRDTRPKNVTLGVEEGGGDKTLTTRE